MTDLESKIRRQLAAVLAGEAGLVAEAHKHDINIDRIEEKIKDCLADKKMFGYDDVLDVINCGYIIGRRDQAIATFVDLVGKEKVQELYQSVCIELGLEPKRLN
jgi:hypothetical protein